MLIICSIISYFYCEFYGCFAIFNKTFVLQNYGFNVIDFPYFYSKGDSAVGCYLNYLETEKSIFLPVFGVDTDNEAINKAKNIFDKTIIPVNINEIAEKGGLLNCISWDFE